MKFLEYLYQDDVMLEHNIRCTQIPAKKSLAQSEEYKKEVPYADVLVGILDQGQFIGNFNTDRLKETINNTFVSYCSGGIRIVGRGDGRYEYETEWNTGIK